MRISTSIMGTPTSLNTPFLGCHLPDSAISAESMLLYSDETNPYPRPFKKVRDHSTSGSTETQGNIEPAIVSTFRLLTHPKSPDLWNERQFGRHRFNCRLPKLETNRWPLFGHGAALVRHPRQAGEPNTDFFFISKSPNARNPLLLLSLHKACLCDT